MEIEKKINEISDYFKNKILAGDFDFIKCDECTARILIDNKYKFELWIANTPKYNFRIHGQSIDTTIFNTEFKNQKERIKGYSKVKPFIQKGLDENKQKEIEALKQQLENLTK